MRSLNHIHSSSGSQILIYTPWSLCGQNVCVCGCVRVCVCVCLGVFGCVWGMFGWGPSRFFQEIFSLRKQISAQEYFVWYNNS